MPHPPPGVNSLRFAAVPTGRAAPAVDPGLRAWLQSGQGSDATASLPINPDRTAPGQQERRLIEQNQQCQGPRAGLRDRPPAQLADHQQQLKSALSERGTDFDCTIYPGLGHGFLGAWAFDESSPLDAPGRDAWDRANRFLKEATVRSKCLSHTGAATRFERIPSSATSSSTTSPARSQG